MTADDTVKRCWWCHRRRAGRMKPYGWLWAKRRREQDCDMCMRPSDDYETRWLKLGPTAAVREG